MNGEEREKMLDLLCDKFVFGLDDEQARELEKIGYDRREAESIELTVATLGMVGLDTASEMPAHLRSKLLANANEYFGEAVEAGSAISGIVPAREIVLESASRPWFSWLGWAVAASASIALAVTLFTGRGIDDRAGRQQTPTPEERLNPEQQRQKLLESSHGQVIMAQWGKGKMEDVTVSGDIVWSDEKQVGYMRLRGLPKNDAAKETYQLWIVDENQDPTTPIDGGIFDVTGDGEVIIPIDAKLKVVSPKAFAITIEKPGGVVRSKQGKLAALAPVKPNQV